jgi:hypothetical protein
MADDQGYTVNTNGRLQRLIELVAGHPPTLEKMFRAFDKPYRAFIRARWRKFSRGGGNWRPLAEATVIRKGNTLILIETSLAYKSVDPEFTQVFAIKPASRTIYQADVTFGSNATYQSGKTVNQIMGYHQEGRGNLPQRKVIVSPDTQTKQNMAARGAEVLRDFLNKRA